MMKYIRTWWIVVFSVLQCAAAAGASDVILYPGYVQGTISAPENFALKSYSINAYTSGYSASKSGNTSPFDLTLQGGDADYTVHAAGFFVPQGSSSPGSRVSFPSRTVHVGIGQTVAGVDFRATAVIHVKARISGDSFSSGSLFLSAIRPDSSTESTSSQFSGSSMPTVYEWDIPVVSGTNIQLVGNATLDSKTYQFWEASNTSRYVDAGEGQTIEVVLDLVHQRAATGAVEGAVSLDLTSGGIDMGGTFSSHTLSFSSSGSATRSFGLSQNPSLYRLSETPAGETLYPSLTSSFRDGSSLIWPRMYLNGLIPGPGETVTRNFTAGTGIVDSTVNLTGVLSGRPVSYLFMIDGLSFYDRITGGSIQTPTSGGSMTVNVPAGARGKYRYRITPGEWEVGIRGTTDDSDNGYWRSSTFILFKKPYDPYGRLQFGGQLAVTAGAVTTRQDDICTGSASLRFGIAGSGAYYSMEGYGLLLYTNSANNYLGYSSIFSMAYPLGRYERPELVFYGPPGTYAMSPYGTTTDGSRIAFAQFPLALECGVRKGQDISGPSVSLIFPVNQQPLSGTVVVSGTATDPNGIRSVVVNAADVPFASTGNANDPREISFSASVPLTDGVNSITTVITDNDGNQATDDRTVCSDSSVPTVSFTSPAAGSAVKPGSEVAVRAVASDTGCGYSLKVFLQGSDTPLCDLSPQQGETACNAVVVATSSDQTLTAVAADRAGHTATATVIIRGNLPPSVATDGPWRVSEGGSVTLTATGTDPEGGNLTYAWDLDADGVFETIGASVVFAATEIDGESTRTVSVRATDEGGLSAVASAAVTIFNAPPTAVFALSSASISEGGSVTAAFSQPFDPGSADRATGFTYAFDCDGDGAYEKVSASASAVCQFPNNGLYRIGGRIIDRDGAFTEYVREVSVANLAPTIGEIATPIAPAALTTSIQASVPFADAGVFDTHTAVWNWGDGTSSVATVTESGGSGTASGSHFYTAPGVYTVTVTVADGDGGTAVAVAKQYVVTYDAGAGFITGGGWIESPAGAFSADVSIAGKANFGFVARYQKGASLPTGQTEFNFRVGSLNFHSVAYEWLVVAGSSAKYKGAGTINGSGDYGFMLTATDTGDGSSDSLRMKIWNRSTGAVVYDNRSGTSDDGYDSQRIEGGNIVIHHQ